MEGRLRLTALLVAMGAGWGLSVPLGKLAVSTGHQPFGLIFWEQVIVAGFLGGVCLLRTRAPWRMRGPVMRRATLGRYLMVAALGTVIPGWAYYFSAQHLPGGVLAILLSTVPMLAFPVALVLGNEVFRLVRLGGLACGMAGIVLLIAPQASLPDPAMAAFIPVALIAPLCYACEGNALARWGTAGVDPIALITGASLVGIVVMLPLALLSGQWIDPRAPWGVAEGALVLSALAHAVVYSGYVWMVGRAGSVFAAQVSYLVTGFGVLWSMALLSETYSGYVWGALGLMVLGLALVQPRPRLARPPGQPAG